MSLAEVDNLKWENIAGCGLLCSSHHSVVAIERERPLWSSRGTALKVVHTAFVDDDVPQGPLHEAELTSSLLVEVSRGGDSPWHCEQILGPDGSHWDWPDQLRRGHSLRYL